MINKYNFTSDIKRLRNYVYISYYCEDNEYNASKFIKLLDQRIKKKHNIQKEYKEKTKCLLKNNRRNNRYDKY